MHTKHHLKYPYSFEQRRPIFEDCVLFIPDFYTEAEQLNHKNFFNQDWLSLFKERKIYVEYCSGNGQWICEMAKQYPNILWIGCELKYERVKKIYKRIKTEAITNCIIAFGQAEVLTKYYLPQESIASVFINFPDPWPKKRHAKHRLFQPSFLNDLKQAMLSGSEVILATDDLPYLEEAINVLNSSGFIPVLSTPYYQILPDNYGYSFFEDLWTLKGKQNYQTLFFKP